LTNHGERWQAAAMLGAIRGQAYLENVVFSLVRSYSFSVRHIAVHVDAGEISLNMDEAILCGLIVNELVSNALKYAFAGESGEIKVSLTMPDDEYRLLRGEMDGIEAAGVIRREMDIPVIYLAAYTDEEKIERASITEPFAYIVKPFEDRELHSNIQMALYRHSIEKRLKQTLDESWRLNKVCVEREFRIKELRDEVAALKEKLATSAAGDKSPAR